MNKAIERAFDLLHQLRDSPEDFMFWNLMGFIQGLYWADVIDSDQFKSLHALVVNANIHCREPFPTMLNAGPCISWWELHKRNVATHLLEKPQAVPANEPAHLQPVSESDYLEPCPECEGNGEVNGRPCVRCAGSARVPVDLKPQAVPVNEPVQLQPVAARRELRLLCLLVKGRDDQAQSLPVHTLRPMPPRVCSADANHRHALHRWCLEGDSSRVANNSGLYLRETHAKRPTAEVLERCGKYRQAGAIRTATRAVRTNGVSV